MQRGRYMVLAVLAGALALAASAPRAAHAATIPSQPVAGAPAGWMHTDIGIAAEGSLAGDTKYDPATGQWAVSGSGSDLWDTAHDDFQYAFTPVKGDGSITARLLSTTGGHYDDGWEKIGLMIRADLDDTTDSALAQVEMTNRNGGVYWHRRPGKAQGSAEIQGRSSREVGLNPAAWPYPHLFMRTQRVGSDFSGFISYDNMLWRNVGWTLGITDFGDTANFGLSVMAHDTATLSTAVFDNVAATAGLVTPYGVYAAGGDKSATLHWQALKGATGYNVYRGPANVAYDELTPDMLLKTKLTATPITATSFTDSDASLTPATRYVYGVTAMVSGKETMPVVARANIGGASSTLPGFTSVNIGNDPLRIGDLSIDIPHGDTGADFNPATGLIKINGGGFGIGNPNATTDTADEFNFTHQAVTGNFQVTVNALRFPTYQNAPSIGGLMIREDLTAGARNAFLTLHDENGLAFQNRTTKGGSTTVSDPETIGTGSVLWGDVRDHLNAGKPLILRLTRAGDKITAEYSLDGTTFKAATGSPVTLTGLSNSVEVGLAVSGSTVDDGSGSSELRVSEMILRDLNITKQ